MRTDSIVTGELHRPLTSILEILFQRKPYPNKELAESLVICHIVVIGQWFCPFGIRMTACAANLHGVTAVGLAATKRD
jgi:hypothetical protein